MRLSSKVSYGVQALFDLAYHGAGRAAQAREIAERQGIPLRYLEQILQDLRRAGLVEAKRGPRGGYGLARPAERIRLSDVIEALEGPLAELLAVEEPAERGARTGTTPDVPALVWRELATKIGALYAEVTLADLASRAAALGLPRAEPLPQMYFI